MSLKTKFLVYLVVVHAVFIAAAAVFLRTHRLWLPVVELFFVLSFLVGWLLTRRLSRPGEVLRTSIDLLESEDFMTRFRESHEPEVDRLVRLYNRMADHLREQRVANQEQDSLLTRLIEVSPSGMIALDFDGRIETINPGACEILGVSSAQVTGSALKDISAPAFDELESLPDAESRLITFQGRRRIRCRRLTFLDRGFSRTFLILEELTKELHASEKAAWEKLIRTMSHEINNTSGAVISLLTSCLSYADQLAPEDRTDFEEGLNVAVTRTRHMNAFMKGFADVVRLPEPTRSSESVEDLVRRVARLLDPEREHRRIHVRWSIDPAFPAISIDPAQMEQALLNILKNAFDAVGMDGEVAVTLAFAADRPFLLVEDSGGGIPPDMAPKLFTSFFTSKPAGQGIGLTLVQEILIAHGFEFSLETTSPGRAGFRIEFTPTRKNL